MPVVPGDQGQDATALNLPSMPIVTDWARSMATVAKSGIAETMDSCVQAAESEMRAGHVIDYVKCPCCTAA